MKLLNIKYLLLLALVVCATSCGPGNLDHCNNPEEYDFACLKAAENAYSKREAIEFMSLKTMFPNEQVRALAKAVGKGRIKTIEKLVDQGIDVNSQGKKGATPLYWAMRKNNVKGFRKLLELGADPDIMFDGDEGEGKAVIHYTIDHKNLDFLRLVLEHGANPNQTSYTFEQIPLHNAIGIGGWKKQKKRDISVIMILLDHGADINKGDISGNTPVMNAVSKGRFDVVYLLLNNGADYNLKNDVDFDLMDEIAHYRAAVIPDSKYEKAMN
ncbi:MAG: ankyrin repeat domain-containing protein, partial [Gammaproteobacteria bacterium]